MKIPSFSCCRAFVAALAAVALLPTAAHADDLTPPVLVTALPDITIPAGTTHSKVKLTNTFGLSGVTGPVVRMATVLGNIDVEVLTTETPLNAANFLNYVNSGEYNGTFIHRSVSGFVIQGGGYYVTSSGEVPHIAVNAAVTGEHVRSNTVGTLALALSTGPDTGTSEWFFNLADNTQLDGTDDGGPFTVFARVIEGDMTTVNDIAALPVVDLSTALNNAALNTVPVVNYTSGNGVSPSNLVYLNDAVVIPMVPPTEGADAVLKLKAVSQNPALVTATLVGRKIKLAYVAGQTGTARIKVIARDSTGAQVKTFFTITVQ